MMMLAHLMIISNLMMRMTMIWLHAAEMKAILTTILRKAAQQ